MSEESNKNPSTPDNSFTPKWTGCPFLEVKFHGNNLRQDSVPFLHKNVVTLYISYKLDTWSRDLKTDFTLGICLFGAVKLTKNVDPEKYRYSGYGFDARSKFSWSGDSWGKNVIFRVDNSSSVHADNKKKIS